MPDQQSVRLIVLDSLTVPGNLGRALQDHEARRLCVLLSIGTEANRRGGLGRATRVFNCFGEPLCLKSVARVSHGVRSEQEALEAFRTRAYAFRDEYLCQKILLGISHTPQVYGYGTYAGGPVMLMEWVQGVSLRSAYLRERLDAYQCAAIGAHICATLLAARTRDVQFVHRDISGGNILVRTHAASATAQKDTGTFDLCLIDYGSALCMDVREYVPASDRPTVWRNATPEYAAPEMLTHSDPTLLHLRSSHKVDVYALCSVLWELYWGHTPYMLAKNKPASAFQFKMKQCPQEEDERMTGDEEFLRTLRAGISPSPDNRPDLAELWDAFATFCKRRDERMYLQIRQELDELLAEAQRPAAQHATLVRE